jgi:hypothetical protein
VKQLTGAIALLFIASAASAQVVGHPPDKSPFRDIAGGQELTLFGGHYAAGTDPLGVAPKPGAAMGLLYQIHVGGPAYFTVGYTRANGSRMAVNPTLGKTNRDLGSHNTLTSIYDIGMSLNLTGMKSFHHIVPVITAGGGVASCTCEVDNDPYQFGTPFALSFGAGLRYMPGGHYQIRVDLSNYLYQLHYPAAYYINSADNTPVAAQDVPHSFWKNNRSITIGVSRLFFR